MEKPPLPPEDPVVRPESTVTLDDSDFESHEDDESVVYTPRSSHFGDAHPDLPPSYDESQAAHAEAQAQARSQLPPGRENHSDVSVYRTELPPDPSLPPRDGTGKEGRAPSPSSGPSILLNQALTFTQELPATDGRFAHELTRPIAVPSLPGNVEPMKFARFYATILHHHSISPAQFMDFIDGLNALSKACSANPAYLRGMDPGYEILNENITPGNLVPAYLAQTNHTFFAPRGLQVRVLTLNQLAELVKIPTSHHIRHSMLSEAIRSYAAGAEVPTAANGAARATSQTLEPYIEPLSSAVPEPKTTIEALNSVAARFANLNVGGERAATPRPGPQRSRSVGSAIPGPSSAREGEAGPSTEPALPLWHPHTVGRFAGDWGGRQGKFWNDWGEKQGDYWTKWGEKQGDKWGKWGEKQGDKWGKWGEKQGEKWAKWGEDFGKKMMEKWGDDSGRKTGGDAYAEGGRNMPGAPVGAGPGTNEGPTPEQVFGSGPPMPGAFPMAPGPRGAMIAAMAARSHGAAMATAAMRGGHGPALWHGGAHPWGAHTGWGGGRGGVRGGGGRAWGGGGFGGARFAGGPHHGHGVFVPHGGLGDGRFGYGNPDLDKRDDDDSDTSSVSSSSSDSSSDSESTAVSERSNADAIFTQRVREIEKHAAEARAKGKKSEEDIEKERQKSLRKADEERSKAVAEFEKRRDKRNMKAEMKAFKHEWKRNVKAEAKNMKKQAREEKRAMKADRRHYRRHGNRHRESREERHDRRRREWDTRWEGRKREWELRREQLERGRREYENRWDARRRAWEQRWNEKMRNQERLNEARGVDSEGWRMLGMMPGAYPEDQDQGIVREESNLSGADDIMWVVVGNLEA